MQIDEESKAPGFGMRCHLENRLQADQRANGIFGILSSRQIAQALYEKYHLINTLKHVVVMDIVNENTMWLLEQQIYGDNSGRVPPINKPEIFEYGTAEYEALLGTRTGAVVAYLVLGAFARGTRRISRIAIENPRGECVNLRFDIENVNPGPPSSSESGSTGTKRRRIDDDEEYQQTPKRRKSPDTASESYDGPARRTRQLIGFHSP
ncbi:hypothetical protein F1880_001866 [Penicillium rolfsii]|nr:hypothetical protein F1880_001866 [Penicillium rolfsii]